MPCISHKDAQRLNVYSLKIWDVVFSRVGRVGSCFLVRETERGWIISGQMLRIRLPDQAINRKYLIHALRSKDAQDQITGASVGSTRQSINTTILESLRIPVPKDREQQKIAEVLDTVDDAIATTTAHITKLKQAKAGLLHDLLTRGIDENGELRDPIRHPEKFQDSALGKIPLAWTIYILEGVGQWLSGGTPSKSNPSYWNGEIPWVSPKDMKSLFLQDSLDHISEEGASSSRFVPADTIFIVVRGMILAHSFPVALTRRDMAFNQDIKGLICYDNIIPRYLLSWLIANSTALLKLVTESTHGTKRLDMKDFLAYQLALPLESEQRDIVQILHQEDTKIDQKVKKLNKLALLKQGLMSDLLTGRVRVKLDSSEDA